METCIFCRMVKGEAACHVVWEDERHLAFLSIYPNTPGFTVVITKAHYSSYAFELPEDVYLGLVLAAKRVGKLLDDALDDVGRTGLIFEGFGVDHVHAKLFPMHGTKFLEWRPVHSTTDKVFTMYEGFIATHDGPRADDAELSRLAARIRTAGA